MSLSRQRPARVIGIAGGSGCGKTELALSLLEALHPHATLVSQDWYYRDRRGVSAQEEQHLNFDHPDAIETALLRRHLLALKALKTVESPRYDYATHSRMPRAVPVAPAPIVLLEGILILHDARLRELLDLSVFIDVPPDVRLVRRIRRDCNRRGISVDETLRLYETFVRPMHERFVQPSARHASLVWDQLTDTGFPARLKTRIQKLLQK